MKAAVFHDIGDVRVEDVPDPGLRDPHDAIVRITTSAICGTDLHMIRGTMPGMEPGTILGHEGVGIVEAVGSEVRNFKPGDRVVIPSTIACGFCSYCRAGYFAQCDNANPNGKTAGTAFFGGPRLSGPFDGLQAEKARVPYANIGLVKIPDQVTDDQAILISDIFPTGYFGAELAEIRKGDTVAVFGCGPVGLFAILSAQLMGAGRVIAVDEIEGRLERAKALGAEVVDFSGEDPVEVIRALTGGIGVDRVIDAVGVDANQPHSGPAAEKLSSKKKAFEAERKTVAPASHPKDGNWESGDAPSLALQWSVQSLAKAGTLSVIGVYPQTMNFFPFGEAMMHNLTIRTGNCNHRKYIPHLLQLTATGVVDPADILSHEEHFEKVLEAYKAFDKRMPGWIKVGLKTDAAA